MCAVRKSNRSLARIRSYTSNALGEEDFKIWEAARATSAATSFFSPLAIGEGAKKREYVDGALGFNNPAEEVWLEAKDIWRQRDSRLESALKCFVSIGTGNPGTSAVGDKPWSILNTLKNIATQTEDTEERFGKTHDDLCGADQRYYRFNVEQGLQNIGLEEYQRQGDIADATFKYLAGRQQTKNEFEWCAANLSRKECMTVEDFS